MDRTLFYAENCRMLKDLTMVWCHASLEREQDTNHRQSQVKFRSLHDTLEIAGEAVNG